MNMVYARHDIPGGTKKFRSKDFLENNNVNKTIIHQTG